jgi:hypothetical protein
LNLGRVVSIVAPKEFDNRTPEASFRKIVKAYAIFSIDQLVDHGSPVDEASKFVTTKLEEARVPIGGRLGTPAWKTVKTWRYDAARPSTKDQDQLRDTLETLRQECCFPHGMPLEQLKTALAQLLGERLPQLQEGLE